MATSSLSYDDSGLSFAHLQALASELRWDNTQTITFFLGFSDVNNNSTDDWLENGAGTALRAVLQHYSDIANITFSEVSTFQQANLIEIIDDAGGALGFHFLPGDNGSIAYTDGVQTNGEFNGTHASWTSGGLAQGGYAYITLLHELGHGMGLEHPHDSGIFSGIGATSGGNFDSGSYGDNDLNQGVYTVMSYNDGFALRGGSPSDDYGWQGTLAAFDIATMQALYGANTTFASGADSYALPDSNTAGTFYETIWDTGGIDEIRYDGTRDTVIFLTAATLENTSVGGGVVSFAAGIEGGVTIANGVTIENAISGSGNDLLAGNDADNTLTGNAGDDWLFGLGGSDVINGGSGNDIIFGDGGAVSSEYLSLIDPAFSGGISLGSGAVTAGQATQNGSVGSAIDVSSDFSLAANANVSDATTIPHVTISGTGNDALDVFAITINNPYATITVDIDGASFDTYMTLADAAGTPLQFNDDSSSTSGAGGSSTTTDSYLRFTPGEAGTYYISIAKFGGGALNPIDAGATYTLNISVDNEYEAVQYTAYLDIIDDLLGI